MKERNLFLFLVAIIILTSIILFTNIGYANENLISSNTNYSSKDFNVEFNKNSNNISNNINIISSKKVSLNTIVLNNLEETQVFTIPVINNSNNLSKYQLIFSILIQNILKSIAKHQNQF